MPTETTGEFQSDLPKTPQKALLRHNFVSPLSNELSPINSKHTQGNLSLLHTPNQFGYSGLSMQPSPSPSYPLSDSASHSVTHFSSPQHHHGGLFSSAFSPMPQLGHDTNHQMPISQSQSSLLPSRCLTLFSDIDKHTETQNQHHTNSNTNNGLTAQQKNVAMQVKSKPHTQQQQQSSSSSSSTTASPVSIRHGATGLSAFKPAGSTANTPNVIKLTMGLSTFRKSPASASTHNHSLNTTLPSTNIRINPVFNNMSLDSKYVNQSYSSTIASPLTEEPVTLLSTLNPNNADTHQNQHQQPQQQPQSRLNTSQSLSFNLLSAYDPINIQHSPAALVPLVADNTRVPPLQYSSPLRTTSSYSLYSPNHNNHNHGLTHTTHLQCTPDRRSTSRMSNDTPYLQGKSSGDGSNSVMNLSLNGKHDVSVFCTPHGHGGQDVLRKSYGLENEIRSRRTLELQLPLASSTPVKPAVKSLLSAASTKSGFASVPVITTDGSDSGSFDGSGDGNDDDDVDVVPTHRPAHTHTNSGTGEDDKPRGCHCKKSKCLKLYCECFARQGYCVGCACSCCQNTPKHAEARDKAISLILERDPQAFFRSGAPSGTVESTSDAATATKKGCHCKKSGCLKKYCECYQAGVSCNEHCRCLDCKNGKCAHDDDRRDSASNSSLAVDASSSESLAELQSQSQSQTPVADTVESQEEDDVYTPKIKGFAVNNRIPRHSMYTPAHVGTVGSDDPLSSPPHHHLSVPLNSGGSPAHTTHKLNTHNLIHTPSKARRQLEMGYDAYKSPAKKTRPVFDQVESSAKLFGEDSGSSHPSSLNACTPQLIPPSSNYGSSTLTADIKPNQVGSLVLVDGHQSKPNTYMTRKHQQMALSGPTYTQVGGEPMSNDVVEPTPSPAVQDKLKTLASAMDSDYSKIVKDTHDADKPTRSLSTRHRTKKQAETF